MYWAQFVEDVAVPFEYLEFRTHGSTEAGEVRWDLFREFWRDGMLGLLILLAVGADAVLMQRLERVRQRKALQKHARLVKAKSQANRAEV